jgi:predicted flap endonuclease-1-like 5' DNA nuclease
MTIRCANEANTKIVLLVARLYTGVHPMANKEQDAGMFSWVILVILSAVGVWLWMRWDEEARQNAEAAARKALDAAEKTARQASQTAQTTIQDVREKVTEKAEQIKIQVEEALEDVEEAIVDAGLPAMRGEIDELEAAPPAEPEIDAPAPIQQIEAPEAMSRTDIDIPASALPKVGDVAGSDDLTRIEGIGPKLSDVLVIAGIKTFAALASTSTDRLTEIIKAAGVRKPGSIDTWAKQAGYAAKGDWKALAAYQKTLSSGRKSKSE